MAKRSPSSYLSLAGEGKDQFTIKKSVFIGRALPVTSQEEAEEKIEEVRTLEAKATHNCTAYILGKTGGVQKYDDDGEPQGTAGPPMLEVLKKREVRDALLVVTRYFGGIKLGAPGLVRAYTDSASRSLDAAGLVRMEACLLVEFSLDYDILGKYLHILQDFPAHEEGREFGAQVTSRVSVPLDKVQELEGMVMELSRGQAGFKKLGKNFRPRFKK